MVRNILILILVTAALALLRWLVKDITRAIASALKGAGSRRSSSETTRKRDSKRLVKDPVSGTYIDERFAVKDTIEGNDVFFENEANRDAYRRQQSSG
jgi:YHS domain-containing protein